MTKSPLQQFLETHRTLIDDSRTVLAAQFSSPGNSLQQTYSQPNDTSSEKSLLKANNSDDAALQLCDVNLHPYQKAGVQWLLLRYKLRLSCIVADEMVDEVVLHRARQKLSLAEYVLDHPCRTTGNPASNILRHGIVQLVKTETEDENIQSSLFHQHESGSNVLEDNKMLTDPIVEQLLRLSVDEMLAAARVCASPVESQNDKKKNKNHSVTPCLVANVKSERGIYEFEGHDYKEQIAKVGNEHSDWFSALAWLAPLRNNRWGDFKLRQQPSSQLIPQALLAPSGIGHFVDQKHLSQRMRRSSGYVSCAVRQPHSLEEQKDTAVNDAPTERPLEKRQFKRYSLIHITGDANRPNSSPPWVILHCVDACGRWPNAGFFSAITQRWGPGVKNYYKSAARAHDLCMGDMHLYPINDAQEPNQQPTKFCSPLNNTKHEKWIGLLVAQHRHDDTSFPERGQIDLNCFKISLQNLEQAFGSNHLTVHLPRIGDAPAGRSQWYPVEHLLQRYLADKGYPVYVYYFKKKTEVFMSQSSRHTSRTPSQAGSGKLASQSRRGRGKSGHTGSRQILHVSNNEQNNGKQEAQKKSSSALDSSIDTPKKKLETALGNASSTDAHIPAPKKMRSSVDAWDELEHLL